MARLYDKHCDGDYQRAVGDMVAKHVHGNCGELVEALRWFDWEYYEELMAIGAREDYQEALEEHAKMLRREDLVAVVLDHDADVCEMAEMTDADVLDEVHRIISEDLSEDERRELADEWSVEPYQIEALEHWVVSDWLARQLEQREQMVARFGGVWIWGRTTSGQSIALDGCICSIYDDCYGDAWRAHYARPVTMRAADLGLAEVA